jgi:hypothetical protein
MTLRPGYYRDEAVRGNVFQRQYRCLGSDNAPVSLAGYSARWRGVYGDVIIEKTTEDGSLSMASPVTGIIDLVLSPAETRLVPVDENMKYELEIFAGASQQTILYGDLVGKGGTNID